MVIFIYLYEAIYWYGEYLYLNAAIRPANERGNIIAQLIIKTALLINLTL